MAANRSRNAMGTRAIYPMTPCSEEAARAALKHIVPEPRMPVLRKLLEPEEEY
jgi:hypothetical protein